MQAITRSTVEFSRQLLDDGFSVLRFDQPHSGNSGGPFIDSSFTEWVGTICSLAQKYIAAGYTVCLLGQSMDATATVIAATRQDLAEKIPCLLLWVPDPVLKFTGNPEEVYDEEGQRYRGRFWEEASQADFFRALERYSGAIHLVYGQRDSFISEEIRGRVMELVHEKGGSHMVLPGEGHSSWGWEACESVYERERALLREIVRRRDSASRQGVESP
jgi:pimeloyl-ACP methyl ester carboxylesterase